MDATVTYNSIAFVQSFIDSDSSRRQSSARGVNTPDVLSIRHQDSIDSSNKVAMRRHVVRIDSHQVDSVTGALFKSSAYTVLEISSLATSAQVTALLATYRAMVANVTAGSDVLAAVVNNEG
jgi:hypothetical protein